MPGYDARMIPQRARRLVVLLAALRALSADTAPEIATLADWQQDESLGSAPSADGDTAVFACAGERRSDGAYLGGVCVWVRDAPGLWHEQAKLPGGGNSTSVSGDVLAVGGEDRVRIWRRSAGAWSLERTILAAEIPGNPPDFGWSVDVDGDELVTGASNEWGGGTGRVYAFRRVGGVWVADGSFSAGTPSFGMEVAISGATAVVGAHQWPRPSDGAVVGAAFVYVRVGAGVWTQQALLSRSDLVANDAYGEAVEIDGDVVAVGAPFHVTAAGTGICEVYARSGSSWTLSTTLAPSDDGARHVFGRTVAVDPARIVVGCAYSSVGTAGGAYVFDHVAAPGSPAAWTPTALLRDDRLSSASYPALVEVSGNVITLGAPFHTTTSGHQGAAVTYEYDGVAWHGTAFATPHPRPQAQAVDFPPLASLVYGDAPTPLVASATSGLAVTFTVDFGPGVIAGGALATTGAGSIWLHAEQAGDLTWQKAGATRIIAVARRPLTIRADDQTRSQGQANPTLTATVTGLATGDTVADLDTPISLATSAGPASTPGTYPITASGGDDADYAITRVAGTLTVTAAGGGVTSGGTTGGGGSGGGRHCGVGSAASLIATGAALAARRARRRFTAAASSADGGCPPR